MTVESDGRNQPPERDHEYPWFMGNISADRTGDYFTYSTLREYRGFPLSLELGAHNPDGFIKNPNDFLAVWTRGPKEADVIKTIEWYASMNTGYQLLDSAAKGNIKRVYVFAKEAYDSKGEAENLPLSPADLFKLYMLAYEKKFGGKLIFSEEGAVGNISNRDLTRLELIFREMGYGALTHRDGRIITDGVVGEILKVKPELDIAIARRPQV